MRSLNSVAIECDPQHAWKTLPGPYKRGQEVQLTTLNAGKCDPPTHTLVQEMRTCPAAVENETAKEFSTWQFLLTVSTEKGSIFTSLLGSRRLWGYSSLVAAPHGCFAPVVDCSFDEFFVVAWPQLF